VESGQTSLGVAAIAPLLRARGWPPLPGFTTDVSITGSRAVPDVAGEDAAASVFRVLHRAGRDSAHVRVFTELLDTKCYLSN
jgi:hypothetical protein